MIKCFNNKKKIFYSFLLSAFLLVAGYFSNNWPLFTGENLELLAGLETFNKFIGFHQNTCKNSVIYVNTTFDKIPIDCYSDDEIPVHYGYQVITDRKKLYKFLKLLKGVNYKYLIIDIDFAKGFEDNTCANDSIAGSRMSVDEELFSLIKSLDNVVVATHHNHQLIDEGLENKAALADYSVTVTSTNFVRYEYFDSIPYIPLTVYNNLRKENKQDTIACHKFFNYFSLYTQGHNLCYNSLFLDFSILDDVSDIIDYNLYDDILDESKITDSERNIILDNFNGKYVFIGNFLEDLHDTYAGKQPGCHILYSALKVLDEQKHIVTGYELFVLFIMYFVISLLILSDKNVLDVFGNIDNSLMHFIVDVTSFSIIFFLYHIVEYLYGRTSFSFVIPIITFSIIKSYRLLKKQYKMKSSMLIILIAILSGLLMSFTPYDNDKTLKIHSLNSNRILVDGVKAETGMMISPNAKFTFSHPTQWVKILNLGESIIVYCEDCHKEEILERGKYKYVKMQGSQVNNNRLFWWITFHKTSSKGGVVEMIDDVEYMVGDARAFEVDIPVKRQEQYYEFEVINGKFKGKKFKAAPDDKDSLIWITRDMLAQNGIYLNVTDEYDSVFLKLTYFNDDYSLIIKNSFELITVK